MTRIIVLEGKIQLMKQKLTIPLLLFLGQSYQDYNCPAGEEHMQCPVDPNMQITATTHATWQVL